jgi:hypothetical protein
MNDLRCRKCDDILQIDHYGETTYIYTCKSCKENMEEEIFKDGFKEGYMRGHATGLTDAKEYLKSVIDEIFDSFGHADHDWYDIKRKAERVLLERQRDKEACIGITDSIRNNGGAGYLLNSKICASNYR